MFSHWSGIFLKKVFTCQVSFCCSNSFCFYRASCFQTGLFIHLGVFTSCIKNFGSDKQVAKWLPLATNLNIIGTYAQTELAHGKFHRVYQFIETLRLLPSGKFCFFHQTFGKLDDKNMEFCITRKGNASLMILLKPLA